MNPPPYCAFSRSLITSSNVSSDEHASWNTSRFPASAALLGRISRSNDIDTNSLNAPYTAAILRSMPWYLLSAPVSKNMLRQSNRRFACIEQKRRRNRSTSRISTRRAAVAESKPGPRVPPLGPSINLANSGECRSSTSSFCHNIFRDTGPLVLRAAALAARTSCMPTVDRAAISWRWSRELGPSRSARNTSHLPTRYPQSRHIFPLSAVKYTLHLSMPFDTLEFLSRSWRHDGGSESGGAELMSGSAATFVFEGVEMGKNDAATAVVTSSDICGLIPPGSAQNKPPGPCS